MSHSLQRIKDQYCSDTRERRRDDSNEDYAMRETERKTKKGRKKDRQRRVNPEVRLKLTRDFRSHS